MCAATVSFIRCFVFCCYSAPWLACRQVGEPGWHAVRREFGRSVFRPDDTLDRQALGALVFGQPERLKTLNRLMQSHIMWAFLHQLFLAFAWRWQRVVVVDVPLLFETNMQFICSDVLVVAASEELQLQRVMARDGLEEDAVRQRIAAQWYCLQNLVVCKTVAH